MVLGRKNKPEPIIRVWDDRCEIESNGNTHAMFEWSNISKIHTYKLDLFTTDCICLLVESDDLDDPLELSEEWIGFEQVIDALPHHFSNLDPNWYALVMKPAFEPNYRIIYDRNSCHVAV